MARSPGTLMEGISVQPSMGPRGLSGDVDGIPDPPAMRVARSRVGHVRWLDRGTCHYVSPQGSTGQCDQREFLSFRPRARQSGRFFPP
jgi:hypothetical protein